MIKTNIRLMFVLLTILFIPSVAIATAPKWNIVQSDSTLTFTATQNNAPVTGSFKNFSGIIFFDPSQLKDSNVRIVVEIGSISTSYGEVADTLKTPDWFNATAFPQAIFKAHSFTKTGNNTYQADGTLTIRDKTLPVKLTFSLEEYSDTHARAKGTTTIKRTLFGLGKGEWAKTSDIKDDVQVSFELIATK